MKQLRDVAAGSLVTIPLFNDGRTYIVQPSDSRKGAADIDIVAPEDGKSLTAPCQIQVEVKESMANNIAYSTFEHTIMTIYDHGVLTLELLDALAKDYEGMDVDTGGKRDMEAKDGKSLEDVCIGLIDPVWVPVRDKDENYDDPEDWKDEEKYYKWSEIRENRWGWV